MYNTTVSVFKKFNNASIRSLYIATMSVNKKPVQYDDVRV